MVKPSIFARYRTYDPATEGYGDPDQWRKAFGVRMGLTTANSELGDQSPHVILGTAPSDSWTIIRRAYLALVKACHPDTGGDPAQFRKVQAAFEVLENSYGK